MKSLVLFVILLSLTSCDLLFHGATSPSPLVSRPPLAPPPSISPQGDSAWGTVFCDTPTQGLFIKHVKQFLSTTVDARIIGPVNCTPEQIKLNQGGFLFRGQVLFDNGGVFNPSVVQTLQVSTDSYIDIHVTALSGPPIKPIRLQASPAGGIVENNFMSLSFEDAKGLVSLSGSVDAHGFFTGDLNYENFTTFEGTSSGYSGTIGKFRINACSFLKCF